MVESFDWLAKNTPLTGEQIDFLKKYPRGFTVMTDAPRLKMIMELDQEDFEYKNKEEYKKFAFRVAHNDVQKKLISEIGPIFLTSANFSGEKEIYDTQEARKQFANFAKEITYIPENHTLQIEPPSDIFEFVDDTLELNYLRKN
jgi:tRNA A37 threonylcarbamoyladenosine synthetase subunit TsaC/SUA5/YrdC